MKWISVKDRFPRPSDKLILMADVKTKRWPYLGMFAQSRYYPAKYEFWSVDPIEKFPATHWMEIKSPLDN